MNEFRTTTRLMGSVFEFAVVEEDENRAQYLLNMGIAEVERLELLLSEFLKESETTRINKHAYGDNQLPIDAECFELINRCVNISKLTDGCFDITVKSLKQLYDFKNQIFEMPAENLIKEALNTVGYEKIQLDVDKHSIRFLQQKIAISFAAIGKGYASDCVKRLWLQEGVTGGYINASGDLNTIGLKADKTSWKVGVADPNDPTKTLLSIPLLNASAATSGDYEQHFLYDGKRYSHNIDPKTGRPLTGIKSVTICSPSAELSDALATAVYVKGVKEGIEFVNQLPETHAIIIDDLNRCHFSEKINFFEI